jgi:hypothetical protein
MRNSGAVHEALPINGLRGVWRTSDENIQKSSKFVAPPRRQALGIVESTACMRIV